jgi:hypothetical protein
LGDDRRADVAGAARPVVDDELLFEPLRQRLSDHARDDVGRDSGGIGHDDAHRPRRIVERHCGPRQRRQRGSARGQMQKSTALKFHDASPRKRAGISERQAIATYGCTL